jgi:pyruvate/2-oxoglutarate dehydrogenase complex dihydrolipoamide acyltransferase (E2) component
VSSSRTEAALVDVTMPQMGVSVAEGTIVEWKRSVGEEIAADETICEISTDKIDTEVPAPVSGTVAELVVDVGETVNVGTVIARIATEGGEPADAPSGAAPDAASEVGSTEAAAALEPPSDTAAPAPTNGARGSARGRYSPVVQRIAAQHDIDLEQVKGTGRGGRVRKQDVLAYLEEHGEGGGEEPPLHIESPYRPDPIPAAAAGDGLSRMRRQIGEHMKRSLETAATCTTWIEADMTRVEAARRELGVTALPIVARATIDSLREFPALNATLDGDDYRQHGDVNLGIAVSLGDDGLIVPVIHRAQELAPEGLGARIKDLAKRARAKQLVPDDVRGGTFTITNPGQYGSIMATPVINQPQVAILDLEAIVKRPVVIDDAIAIRSMTILGLSWDHRALDGALAAQFLAALKGRLEAWGG